MSISLSHRLFGVVLGTALAGCGSGLSLPEDGSPDDALPARLEAVSGDGQQGTVGSRLEEPLRVRLTDATARPVSATAVEFRFQDSGTDAKLDPASVATDSDGFAEAEVRLGTSTGSLRVEARVVSATQLSATFDLTALARERGKKGKGNEKHDEEGG